MFKLHSVTHSGLWFIDQHILHCLSLTPVLHLFTHTHFYLEKKNTKSGNSSHWWSKHHSLPVTNSKSNKVLCFNCSFSRWWKTIHRFFDFCNIVVTTRCPWSSTNSPARSLPISQQIHHLLFITGSNFLYHLKRDTCASFTVVLRARVAFTDRPRNHPPL